MRVRLKTKAISIYMCTVALTTTFVLLVFLFYGQDVEPRRASFDHMAVDRVMLAHEQRGLWVPEEKPFLVLGQRPQRREASDNIVKMKVEKPEKARLPDVYEMSPTERLTSLSRHAIANLSHPALSELYHSYVETVQYECHDVKRMGRVTDGGWEICADALFVPRVPCVVYSFGIDNDFSFDDAIARTYKCEVHSFDPSMKSEDYKRDSAVHFHKKGVASINGKTKKGWVMETLGAIRSGLGHQKTPLTILKMDIEEMEWQVLPEVLKTESLANVRQLLVEFHTCETCAVFNPRLVDKEPSRDRYVLALKIFKSLYHLGFRIFWSHKNAACKYVSKFGMQERTACHEIFMVQVS